MAEKIKVPKVENNALSMDFLNLNAEVSLIQLQ